MTATVSPRPRVHLSVDDVFGALIEASDMGGRLFDHPFFDALKQLRDRFGASVSLYLFLQGVVGGRRRGLAEVSDRLRDDFADAPWLRLGPHALDYATAPYQQPEPELAAVLSEGFAEIGRFAGAGVGARWLRLHYFSEAYEQSELLRRAGVSTLLLTDKEAVAYRLPASARAVAAERGIVRYQGLDFVRSARRLEDLARSGATSDAVLDGLERELTRTGILALFTHECDMLRPDVWALLVASLERCSRLGVQYIA